MDGMSKVHAAWLLVPVRQAFSPSKVIVSPPSIKIEASLQ